MARPADFLSAGWGTSHAFPLFSSIERGFRGGKCRIQLLWLCFCFSGKCYSKGIYSLLPACYSNSWNGGGPEKSHLQSMKAQFAAQALFHNVRSTGLRGLRQRSESIAPIWVIIIMGAFNGLVLYISLVWADTQSMVLGCALSCFISIFAFLRFLTI